ncbi:M23 family metallopeptidase [Minwuia thermotolerans]|nr:M23 family metallopeptidase [Minwuia thermotolerans]
MIVQEPSYRGGRRGKRITVAACALAVIGGLAGLLFGIQDPETKGRANAAVGLGAGDSPRLLMSQRERDIDAFVERVFARMVEDGVADLDRQAALTGEALAGRRMDTVIRPGDTLARALSSAGADNGIVHQAVTALGKLTDLRRLKPGQELTLMFDHATDKLTEVRLQESVERVVYARATPDGGFLGEEERLTFERQLVRARGTIEDSLFLAGQRAGVEHEVLAELIRMFSFDVDFQRGIHPGDGFELTYERFVNRAGEVMKTGNILKATLVRKGSPLTYFRYQPEGEPGPDYFDARGQSARKTLMQTPIDGARISSGFGKRRHPILGYTKMHKGTDFAARAGTPIMAAGDGTIARIGWNGGYGRYIQIRHNGTYSTAYAHMKGFRSGLKNGSRVKQGQIIGYVGTSGRSTGPHLHYEVLKNGSQVNPRSIKLPTGVKLAGARLDAFQAFRAELDAEIAALPFLDQEVAEMDAGRVRTAAAAD